jgi:hypothetical protein
MILIGIQLIFVLKELRTALKKINNIIEGFEKVGINLEHGFHEFVGFFTGFKTIFKIFEHLSSKKMVNKSDFKTSNLWLGFALGMTAGVGLAYFFGTKKGRQILKEIIETAEKFDLEGVKVFKEIVVTILMI